MPVSVGTAKRLAAAGLKWLSPERGDMVEAPWGEPALVDGVVLGRSALWIELGADEFKVEQLTWLPRLDRVLDEIKRLVPGARITFIPGHEVGCYIERPLAPDIYESVAIGHGPNDTEAAGLALAEILEARSKPAAHYYGPGGTGMATGANL